MNNEVIIMKKNFLIFALLSWLPLIYAPMKNNSVIFHQTVLNVKAGSENSFCNKKVEDISKSARLRMTGRVIGIIVLVLVGLVVTTLAFLAFIFGFGNFYNFAWSMGWTR